MAETSRARTARALLCWAQDFLHDAIRGCELAAACADELDYEQAKAHMETSGRVLAMAREYLDKGAARLAGEKRDA